MKSITDRIIELGNSAKKAAFTLKELGKCLTYIRNKERYDCFHKNLKIVFKSNHNNQQLSNFKAK